MCDKELIVAYLYEEISAEERAVFDAHLATCAECRTELEGLRVTRTQLASWAPPQPELGFRVIRSAGAPTPEPSRRSRVVPAFAFAAAAVLVLAASASLANLELQYGSGGLTVRTGWGRQPVAGTRAASLPAAVQENAASRTTSSEEFAALDRRLRELEAALAANAATGVQNASTSGMSDAEMLKRVRQIVGEAEARQESAFARVMLQVIRDVDNLRRADLAVIQQGLGHYQGLTNAEIAQNREAINQFIRAAAKQEK